MPSVHDSVSKISIEQHTLKIDKNGVLNTILMDQTVFAPPNSMNASVGKEQNHPRQGRVYERQAPEGKVVERKRCSTDDNYEHHMPVASKKGKFQLLNFNVREDEKSTAIKKNLTLSNQASIKGPDVSDKNDERLMQDQIGTKR